MRKRSEFTKRTVHAPFILGILGVIVVTLYSAYVALPFFQGPQIQIDTPGHTVHGTIYLSGTTERVSKLSINELEVPITDTGAFAVERAFPAGYTVVVIKASDRFGRSREEILTFVTQPHASQEESSDQESDSEESGTSSES